MHTSVGQINSINFVNLWVLHLLVSLLMTMCVIMTTSEIYLWDQNATSSVGIQVDLISGLFTSQFS